MRRALVIAACCLAGCGEPDCTEHPFAVAPDRTSVATWERLELTASDIGVTPANPFDPAAVAVAGELRAPDGSRLTVPGFAYQGFTRVLVAGREALTPKGAPTWKVRLTPTAPGAWRWRLKVTSAGSCQASPWAGLFAATAGSGMTWWWDGLVDPQDLYWHLAALAGFVAGLEFDAEAFASGGATPNAGGRRVAAWALRGERVALAWLKDTDSLWYLAGVGAPVEGATLTLAGLRAGTWRAVWHDPYASWAPLEATITVAGEAATLAVPSFSRDVAVRLELTP